MIFGTAGAAYGTAKAGIGIAGVGTFRSDLIMKVCRELEESKVEIGIIDAESGSERHVGIAG